MAAGMHKQAGLARRGRTIRWALLTTSAKSANLLVIYTQELPHFFSLSAYLSGFADIKVTRSNRLLCR